LLTDFKHVVDKRKLQFLNCVYKARNTILQMHYALCMRSQEFNRHPFGHLLITMLTLISVLYGTFVLQLLMSFTVLPTVIDARRHSD